MVTQHVSVFRLWLAQKICGICPLLACPLTRRAIPHEEMQAMQASLSIREAELRLIETKVAQRSCQEPMERMGR